MSNRELLKLHPMVAAWLTLDGYDWRYEVTLAGRLRVDFLAEKDGVSWLIECKITPNPAKDIAQLKLYHELYGDPQTRMMLIGSKYRAPDEYTEAGIEFRQIEVDWSIERDWADSVSYNYPERSGVVSRLTSEQIAEIHAAYTPYKEPMRTLAQRYNVPVSTINEVLRMRGH